MLSYFVIHRQNMQKQYNIWQKYGMMITRIGVGSCMKKKICGALNSSKNIFLKVVKLINKNKKKVVMGLSVFLVVFISVFSFINLRYPTKINAYIAHVINKGEPANSYFDDEVFYKAIIDAYNKENKTSLPYTTNLTDEQLKSIKSVSSFSSERIRSTKGTEKLTSLIYLDLDSNKISNIDLSKNTSLTTLSLIYNNLSSIDLSKNTSLTKLYLFENKISSIDLSKNTALKELDLSGNNLSSIDLSKNTALKELGLSGNNLSSIDLSKNTALKELGLSGNNLSSIDLSNNISLTDLDLIFNSLSSIDLSKNTKLTTLHLYNNPLKLNAYVKENGMLTSSSIKMPEGSDKFYLTYEIEDNDIANFTDNKLNGLKVGKTSATVTLNGVKASSSSTENMKVDGTITVFDRLKGDISNDDKITIADVSLLYRHVRKTKVIEDSETLEVSDITGDGKITIADVAKLYRYVRGKITEL